MDITSLFSVGSADLVSAAQQAASQMTSTGSQGTTEVTFDSILGTAIDNLNTTNAYLSDAENMEIQWAMGEVENTHDLTVALEKASTALQYTIAIRDKLLDAYKELMQMQI